MVKKYDDKLWNADNTIQRTTRHEQHADSVFVSVCHYTTYLAFVIDTLSASMRAGKRALSTPALRLWIHASLGASGKSSLSRSFLPVFGDAMRVVNSAEVVVSDPRG